MLTGLQVRDKVMLCYVCPITSPTNIDPWILQMCGIAGNYFYKHPESEQLAVLKRMTAALAHRGPDDQGFYVRRGVGLGQSRLSIIDLAGGKQPIFNEDKSIVTVFNGEIFNYPELTNELKKKGHRFYTKTDTEVIVHAYEEYGINFLDRLNGQFAIAIWDDRKRKLVLARDRVGIRPLFYTVLSNGELVFASEMKSLFCHPSVNPELDLAGINQVFSLWANVPPRTVFKNICELPPGHVLVVSNDGIKSTRYWRLQFPGQGDFDTKPIGYYEEKLKELLFDSITIRLRADVPVGSYLSGGIDSSIISAIVKKYHNNKLKTFSVAFNDKGYDERSFQKMMVDHLGTDHKIIEASYENIGESFSDVVWFAEKPMIRTAPAPLFLLSGLVRNENFKVVLTGEGADEVFGGYNIFKEDKVRRFWARNPDSVWRPSLLSRLYPYISNNSSQAKNFWQLFFSKNLEDVNNPYYSHLIRWKNTAQIKNLLNKDVRAAFNDNEQIVGELNQYIDPDLSKWHPFSRAQYLEMQLFMSGYLLSSQGDRMMMGNSVEGRFPFLDHRLIEFANTIPPSFKMNVLKEKYILKRAFRDLLPSSIVDRDKQPYRAPIYQCFTGGNGTLASKVLDKDTIDKYGYFDPLSVNNLMIKATKAAGQPLSARDDMAMVGVSSLQLLHHHFLDGKFSATAK